MHKIKDKDLMTELRKRFEEKDRALHDLRIATKNLEDLNQKLRESEAMKSNFLSNIRNEINNPLSSIIGLSKTLSLGRELSEKDVATMANMIHMEAFYLDHQLRNIFAAADIEAGETKLTISHVDIVALINNTVESFRQSMREKKLKMKFKHASLDGNKEGADFQTDPEKVQLIFSNLLSNAIEFSKKGGVIEVHAQKKGERLSISIKDQGIGIKKSDQKIIFDRFRQIDTGTQKSHRGHGLGLSIAKALVELLKGNVSVSSAKNKGSTFAFSIAGSDIDTDADTFSEFGNVYIFEEELKSEQKI
jgi:signal transduction histidine kinase